MTLRRPRLKGSWQPVRTDDGTVWLVHELSQKRLRIRDPERVAWALLGAADGKREAAELVKSVQEATKADRETVEAGIRSLAGAGLLEDASVSMPGEVPQDYASAFRRNAYYFSEFETGGISRYDIFLRLFRSRVAVLGLGGTGSWVVASLLAGGVGYLRGVDTDTVGPENLGRQILYRREDVGKSKAQAMQDEIARFNPAIRFEGHEGMVRSVDDVRRLIGGCDFLVVGCVGPRFTLYRSVNQACLELGIPYLLVTTLQVGPLVVPGTTACHACYEGAARQEHAFYDTMVSDLDTSGSTTDRMPQFGPLVALSGTRAGLDIVRYLSGAGSPESLGAILQVDGISLEWKRYPLERRADCASCGRKEIQHA